MEVAACASGFFVPQGILSEVSLHLSQQIKGMKGSHPCILNLSGIGQPSLEDNINSLECCSFKLSHDIRLHFFTP